VLTVLLCAALLPGCARVASVTGGLFGGGGGGLRSAPQEVEGVRFRSRVQAARESRRDFVVTTRRAARAPAQALEAGRVEGIRYCLTRFGGSEIAWREGPDRPVEAVALTENGALMMRGRCVSR
jgi:hypothetical protein